jgi:dTDP-3-amino-3,4,6-trideoxy-alpha-D-glucose transaminase
MNYQMTIPFNDLNRLHWTLADEIESATQRVLQSGYYILGPEVDALETAFAAYHGEGYYAVGVANGTDAIELALRAGGVGAGDEVITVSHTAVPTVCAIERAGAVPVLVDIDPTTYTMDPAALESAITPQTAAVIPVHIYGHPAEIDSIRAVAQRHGLLLVEDCAQAHGASYKGQKVGTFGDIAAFSFYPTKNMGAYGDGGIVLTSKPAYAEQVRQLRNYGQVEKYRNIQRGINSRLDEIQAAILRVKLSHLDDHNAYRQHIANRYHMALADVELTLPKQMADAVHVYHLYVVRHPQRDSLRTLLQQNGVNTSIHYPTPIHQQPAYTDLGYNIGSLPVTEQMATEIMSLPMFVGLSDDEVQTVCQQLAYSVEQVS